MSYSHEKLSEKTDIAFNKIVSTFDPETTTAEEIEKKVLNYLNKNIELDEEDSFYIKAIIGNITYLDVSNILDDLSIKIEKCCKYDESNNIFLIVLITK